MFPFVVYLTNKIEIRKYKSFWVCVLALLALSLELGAEERVFIARGKDVHVLSSQGESLDSISLETNVRFLVPTPGGKYVFALAADGRGRALDFENPSQTKALDFSEHGPLVSLVFSPMGDRVYVLLGGNRGIAEYEHRAGDVTFRRIEELPVPLSSDTRQIAMNQRGTRFYLPGSGGLSVVLASDLSLIDQVQGTQGFHGWVAGPGGGSLWGIGGDLAVVNSRSLAPPDRFPLANPSPPVFNDNGRLAYVLANGGQTLVTLDVRRPRVRDEESLDETALAISSATSGLWLLGDQNLLLWESGRLSVVAPLPGLGPVGGFAVVELKPGQGFACF